MKKLQVLVLFLIILILLNIYLITSYNRMFFEQDISLDSISEDRAAIIDEIVDTKNEVRIIFTGDVMLGRSVMSRSKQLNDYLYPFRHTADRLSDADLTVINLENSIIKNCPIHTEGFIFCSEPESLAALEYAGVDIASLANNHAFDWGREGFEKTINYLNNSGIKSIGHDNVVYKEVSGVIFSFMGFDFVSNPYELSVGQQDLIAEAVINSDTLIISVHWGNEYFNTANIHQRNMSRKLIELGADMIVGHHPHWIQDVECFMSIEGEFEVVKRIDAESFKKGEGCAPGSIPVYYSLGNFVFDQMWSEETRSGVAVEVLFIDSAFAGHFVYNVYMQKWAQPEWVGDDT